MKLHLISAIALAASIPAAAVAQGSITLQTSLDSAASVSTPAVGPAGTAQSLVFIAAYQGNGANMAGSPTPSLSFPGSVIDLDRGSLSLWLRPNVDSAADTVARTIFALNAPSATPVMILEESDRLRFRIAPRRGRDREVVSTSATLLPRWAWTHVRVEWDAAASDSMRIFVNGARVAGTVVAGGWEMAPPSTARLNLGGRSGTALINGILDEVQVVSGVLPPGSPDAGTSAPDAAPADSGSAPPDAGTSAPDAGPADSGAAPPDAGVIEDAGTATPPDSGDQPVDSGDEPVDSGDEPVDSGTPIDSGSTIDAGQPLDSGVTPDSGVAPDSGVRPDSGASQIDAGSTQADSGASDAGSGGGIVISPPGAVPSAGCGPTNGPRGTISGSINVDGVQRTYILYVPETYDPAVPLALSFGWHGTNWQGFSFRDSSDIETHAAGRSIFVYPDGASNWDSTANSRDMRFLDVLYADLASRYCVATNRVFTWGRSRGGQFANALGCYRASRFAAIGAMSGWGPSGTCGTPRPSAWIYHNQDDTTVSYTSGRASYQYWVSANGCTSATTPQSPTTCTRHTQCANGALVEFCSQTTGGHWPHPWTGATLWRFFLANY